MEIKNTPHKKPDFTDLTDIELVHQLGKVAEAVYNLDKINAKIMKQPNHPDKEYTKHIAIDIVQLMVTTYKIIYAPTSPHP